MTSNAMPYPDSISEIKEITGQTDKMWKINGRLDQKYYINVKLRLITILWLCKRISFP